MNVKLRRIANNSIVIYETGEAIIHRGEAAAVCHSTLCL